MKLPARVALGTMHGKAAAIAPAFARLGITVVVPEGLDTDRFGTFTAEVPRAGTMEEAARAKALAAIAATGCAVGIASEGAYGPHPVIPFLAFGGELILWHDAATGHEIVERLTDASPVYDHAEGAQISNFERFLGRIRFPETAVIVAPAGQREAPVAKGITDKAALAQAIALARSANGQAFVQTDMRAHMNPQRMEVIARLAQKLADRLACPCPDCGALGWGMLRPERGMPCADCGAPTQGVRSEIHGCTLCGAEICLARPDGLTAADPGSCAFCNP